MKDMTLLLLRHGESEWNQKNLFTGWTDVELTDKGREEARQAGRLIRTEGLDIDCCYTSYLKRAIHTLNLALAEMDAETYTGTDLPITISEAVAKCTCREASTCAIGWYFQ